MSKLSNYPPGVTGNEYEIAGPDETWEDPAPGPCPECGYSPSDDEDSDPVTFERYQGNVWWNCPACGCQVDVETDYE